MDRVLDHLDMLPADEAACYSEGPDGRFHLDPDLAAALGAKDAEIAELRAEIERNRRLLTRKTTAAAYRDALFAAGVNVKLAAAAVAMLATQAPVEVPDDPEAMPMATTAWGPQPVEHVVAQFLASPEGEAFQPKAVTAGPLSERMARLRGLH